MINFSVTKNGEPLSKRLYNWDEYTRTFSTTEHSLVLYFSGIRKITFITGSFCTFYTGPHCMFNTGAYCTFNTGSDCVFKNGYNCKFKTGKNCIIIRRDIYEVTKLEKDFNHIKLNGWRIPGYKEIPKVDKELNDFYFTEEDFGIE